MSTIPSASPAEPARAAGVPTDLHCRRCGYNLRTLDWNSSCPECDLPVSVSPLPEGFTFASWRAIRRLRLGLCVFVLGILTSTLLLIGYTFICLNGMQLLLGGHRVFFILSTRIWIYGTSIARIVAVLGMVLTIFACAPRHRRAAIRTYGLCIACALPYVVAEIIVTRFGWLLGDPVVADHPLIATIIGATNAVAFVALTVLFWTVLARCVDRHQRATLSRIIWLCGVAMLVVAMAEAIRQAERYVIYAFVGSRSYSGPLIWGDQFFQSCQFANEWSQTVGGGCAAVMLAAVAIFLRCLNTRSRAAPIMPGPRRA